MGDIKLILDWGSNIIFILLFMIFISLIMYLCVCVVQCVRYRRRIMQEELEIQNIQDEVLA